jgi:hypothetical protein
MLDDVPDFHINPPHALFDDVPAPAGFWGILARHAQHMGESLATVTQRAVREGLLEHRPPEGTC